MKKAIICLVVVIFVASLTVFGAACKEEAVADSITIHWAQWAPADNLEELSADFTAETGIEVIIEQTPW